MNKEIMKAAGFGKQVDRVEKGLCPMCSMPVNMEDFRDELSRKEATKSGMCQSCQDDIFITFDKD